MDFESIMAKIAESENGEELITGIKARLSTVNKEAQTLRKRAKDAEAELDTAKNKKNPVLEELTNYGFKADEEDLTGSLKEFVSSLKETKDADFSKNPQYIKQQKQIEKLLKKSEEAEAEKAKLTIKNRQTQIINELLPAFSKEIMNGKKVLGYAVKENNSCFTIDSDTNEIGFKLPDGDVITGTNAIMEEYKKLNPSEILNKQLSGADSKPTKNSFTVPKQIKTFEQVNAMTREQLMALPEAQMKECEAIISNHSAK